MTKKDSIISEIFKILVLLFLIITLGIIGSALHAKFIEKVIREQTEYTDIDTTKARILFEDTWGKIILIKEEDL